MPRSSAKTSPAAPEVLRKRSAHDRSAVTESMEDYLECIFDLESSKGYACVSDVAEALQLNRASTSIMVKRLGKLGFLRYEPYRGFALTPEGSRVAEKIRKRHAMLAELFQLMGLDTRDIFPTSRASSITSATAPSAASPNWRPICDNIRSLPPPAAPHNRS